MKPAISAQTRESDLLFQPNGDEKRREQGRGKIDRDRTGEGHQTERNDDEALRDSLRRAAAKMITQPRGVQHGEARAR